MPPIWTWPKLAMLMPPVLVSASMKVVWVSSALAGVPMPLTALSTIAAATTSADASLPPSVMVPFGDQGHEAVGAHRPDDDRIRAGGEIARSPTVTSAEPNESATLKMRFTPGVIVDEGQRVGRMDEGLEDRAAAVADDRDVVPPDAVILDRVGAGRW